MLNGPFKRKSPWNFSRDNPASVQGRLVQGQLGQVKVRKVLLSQVSLILSPQKLWSDFPLSDPAEASANSIRLRLRLRQNLRFGAPLVSRFGSVTLRKDYTKNNILVARWFRALILSQSQAASLATTFEFFSIPRFCHLESLNCAFLSQIGFNTETKPYKVLIMLGQNIATNLTLSRVNAATPVKASTK